MWCASPRASVKVHKMPLGLKPARFGNSGQSGLVLFEMFHVKQNGIVFHVKHFMNFPAATFFLTGQRDIMKASEALCVKTMQTKQ